MDCDVTDTSVWENGVDFGRFVTKKGSRAQAPNICEAPNF